MSMHGFVVGKQLDTKNQYFGKYRAEVTNTSDPKGMGRIKVECPKVLGGFESNWCLPCLPVRNKYLPSIGDLVWVEFEEGDSNKPIWSGVWYAEGNF